MRDVPKDILPCDEPDGYKNLVPEDAQDHHNTVALSEAVLRHPNLNFDGIILRPEVVKSEYARRVIASKNRDNFIAVGELFPVDETGENVEQIDSKELKNKIELMRDRGFDGIKIRSMVTANNYEDVAKHQVSVFVAAVRAGITPIIEPIVSREGQHEIQYATGLLTETIKQIVEGIRGADLIERFTMLKTGFPTNGKDSPYPEIDSMDSAISLGRVLRVAGVPDSVITYVLSSGTSGNEWHQLVSAANKLRLGGQMKHRVGTAGGTVNLQGPLQAAYPKGATEMNIDLFNRQLFASALRIQIAAFGKWESEYETMNTYELSQVLESLSQ